jgi:hypothetical protein
MGQVKSLYRTVTRKNGRKQTIRERILKARIDRGGYLLVKLCHSSGKKQAFNVHRLVCEAFLGKPKNKLEVNHINEDKSDNRACNLEWVTSKENNNHGTRTARIAITLSKPVGQYTLDGELIKIWQSAYEVQRQLGFSQGDISNVARGKGKTAYGYIWKYVEKRK